MADRRQLQRFILVYHTLQAGPVKCPLVFQKVAQTVLSGFKQCAHKTLH